MLLELKGISKSFPGVVALNNIDIGFRSREIHAIVGENGAGKSTLIKIISGKYQPDTGQILFKGEKVNIANPHAALKMGISSVYQEYNLIPGLKVIENILLGSEPISKLHKINWVWAKELCNALMAKMDVTVDLYKYVDELGAAESKIIEILKALVANAEIVIMDEPTAALPESDVISLFKLVRSLEENGVTVIYISHRIDEIFSIADRVTILKDGMLVGTYPVSEINHDLLIKSMIGRELKDIYPSRSGVRSKEVVLSVRSLGDGKHIHDITFDLYRGEILGIGGMTGNGQRELIRALFGAHKTTGGSIIFERRNVSIDSPKRAMELGIGFISDDRRNEGLAVTQPVQSNIALPSLHKRQIVGVIRKKQEKKMVQGTIETLGIHITSISQKVENLSGGNQQRVVIAKWLPLNPKVLLFHEPTLGVDVGAKVEIYKLLNKFIRQGVSIIMVTSDMIELLNIPDRILVFFNGLISMEFEKEDASEEAVMYAASGQGDLYGR